MIVMDVKHCAFVGFFNQQIFIPNIDPNFYKAVCKLNGW